MLPRTAIVLAAALLAGCSSLPAPITQRAAPLPAPPSSETIQAALLASYARDLMTVVNGSPTEQAEVIASARAGYEQARQGPAALRYGLLLAAPGHPGHDALQAQRLLTEALARRELLSGVEQALGVVEEQRIAEELRSVTEIERLRIEAQKERERQRTAPSIAALNKRLQTEIEETARLRKELADAKAKLDAIADIERRISDRQPATEGRKP